MANPLWWFDEAELTSVINRHVFPAVSAAAEQTAANARKITKQKVTTTTVTNTRGRKTVLVTIASPGGLSSQAKHGTLTRAAAQVGLRTRRSGGDD